MSMTRRALLAILAVASFAPAMAAEEFPHKPIRMIVPASAGSGPETLARLLADKMSRQMKQTVYVEALPGAAAIIGTDRAAKAAPDGYTVLFGLNQIVTMNPHLYPKLPYSPAKDLAPVSLVAKTGYLILATNSLPASNVAELIALAKQSPGKIAYASTGTGGSQHLGMELFKQAVGIDLLHVPYRAGGTAHTDLISGQIQVMLDPLSSATSLVRGGKVKGLGITTPTRNESLPEVAPVGETIKGFELRGWNAVWVPAKTPPNIVAALNRSIREAMKDPGLVSRFRDLGLEPETSSPEELAELSKKESAEWGELIRKKGIQPD